MAFIFEHPCQCDGLASDAVMCPRSSGRGSSGSVSEELFQMSHLHVYTVYAKIDE